MDDKDKFAQQDFNQDQDILGNQQQLNQQSFLSDFNLDDVFSSPGHQKREALCHPGFGQD